MIFSSNILWYSSCPLEQALKNISSRPTRIINTPQQLKQAVVSGRRGERGREIYSSASSYVNVTIVSPITAMDPWSLNQRSMSSCGDLILQSSDYWKAIHFIADPRWPPPLPRSAAESDFIRGMSSSSESRHSQLSAGSRAMTPHTNQMHFSLPQLSCKGGLTREKGEKEGDKTGYYGGWGHVGGGSVGLLAIDTKLNKRDALYYAGPPGCCR